MRALIAGGGIGGLAAAVALHRAGIEPVVLEKAARIEEVGAGLSLWANAMVALRCLGVEARVAKAGSLLTRAVTITDAGKEIGSIDIAALSLWAGADSVCAHRADLQMALAAALPPGVISTGSACRGFHEDTKGVAVELEDGRSVHGDILIGADGIHSAIRRQLLGDSAPRYAGYVAFRGIAQGPWMKDGEHLFVQGRGTQLGVMPCGEDRTYWFATRNAKAGSRWTKAQLLDLLRSWPEVARAVVKATEERAILQSDVIDRPPSKVWGRGRVTLLGDAIHPTTPNLGQGACQALEDAVVLAECLREESTPLEARLRTYEAQRKRRTAMVTERSWRLGRVLQWENPVATWLRDAMSRSGFGQRAGTRIFEELLCNQTV